MDHSQHTLENHADHSMHSIDHVTIDHSAIMSATTTTDMPANTHIHHDANSVHHHHMPASSTGEAMLHHAMSMSFHFGYSETILFDWWKIDSIGGLLGSMLAIFVMALLYEGLKYYREFLFWKTYNLLEYRPVTGPQTNPEAGQRPAPQPSASPVQYVGEVIHKQPPTMFSLNHFFQTFLHIVQVTVSFLLMLIFMTYNVWLCIAVVLGAGVGYFLFCWKKHLSSTMEMSPATKTSISSTRKTEISMIKPSVMDDSNLRIYDKNKTKAKATNIFRENNKKNHPEEHLQYEGQLNYDKQDFKLQTIPRVQIENNYDVDYDYNTVNNDTITIDSNYFTKPFVIYTVGTSNSVMEVNGCGESDANCANCRNIKILLRLSLRYFYDINCEFVKNII